MKRRYGMNCHFTSVPNKLNPMKSFGKYEEHVKAKEHVQKKEILTIQKVAERENG